MGRLTDMILGGAKQPTAPAPQQQEEEGPGYAEDAWKSFRWQVPKGAADFAGLPDTLYHGGMSLTGLIAKSLGADPQYTDEVLQGLHDMPSTPFSGRLPTNEQLQDTARAATPDSWEDYQPQTGVGDVAGRVGNMFIPTLLMPGGTLVNKGLSMLGAALGGYAGREGSKATGDTLEKWAPQYRDMLEKFRPYVEGASDIGGSIVGSMAPNVLRDLITPHPTSPKRERLAKILEDEGVPVSAGQKTGDNQLLAAESQTGGTAFKHDIRDAQRERFPQAAMKKGEMAFDPSTDDIDDVFNKQHDVIGRGLDRVYAYGMTPKQTTFSDLVDIRDQYLKDVANSNKSGKIEGLVKDLYDKAMKQPQGVDPDWLAHYASTLRQYLRESAGQPGLYEERRALGRILDLVDDGVEETIANVNPADLGKARQLRTLYRRLMVLEDAAGSTDKATQEFGITPNNLARANSKAVGGRRMTARGFGDFNKLSQAGQVILNDAPDSGTTSRWSAAFGGMKSVVNPEAAIGWGVGTMLGNPALGAGAGMLAHNVRKGVMNYARMSPMMQAYLANQLARDWKPGVGRGIRELTAALSAAQRVKNEEKR